MLWIISGPSSAGKSSFIASPRCIELTQVPPGTPVVFPHTAALLDQNTTPHFFFHYNILRPVNLKQQWDAAGLAIETGITVTTIFNQDPQWNGVTRDGMPKKAIVLVTTRKTILRRVRQRRLIEAQALSQFEAVYPVEHWLELYERVDLGGLYEEWCRELEDHGIPYTFVDGTDNAYTILSSDDCYRLLNQSEP